MNKGALSGHFQSQTGKRRFTKYRLPRTIFEIILRRVNLYSASSVHPPNANCHRSPSEEVALTFGECGSSEVRDRFGGPAGGGRKADWGGGVRDRVGVGVGWEGKGLGRKAEERHRQQLGCKTGKTRSALQKAHPFVTDTHTSIN